MPDVQIGGNATADAKVTVEDGGCYTAHNNSPNRNIKFGFGTITVVLNPGTSHTVVDFAGKCITFFNGSIWANYD